MLLLFGSPAARLSRNVVSIEALQRLFTTSCCVRNEISTEDLPSAVAASADVLPQRGPLPLITGRKLDFMPPHTGPRQAWVDNLDTVEEQKLGLVDLHPDIFGAFPRIDLIHSNVEWQLKYRKVDYNWTANRGELPGSSKKPWPQKGLGKARHGSRRSPIWLYGAKAHGPRGPKSHFYMLPFYARVRGLATALSVKLAQDDLKIVDSLDIPTDDPKFLEDLAEQRHWGISVLYVDDTDLMPKNIALSCEQIKHHNLMPVYGLNVYSMLKHETLVLTLAAVNKLEDKLLHWMHTNDPLTPARKYCGQYNQGVE